MGPEQELRARLQRVSARQRRVRLRAKLATGWAATAVIGLCVLLFEQSIGWAFAFAAPVLIVLAILVGVIIAVRHARARPDGRALARQIEERFPQLDGRLLTAVQQDPSAGGELNYLQRRVVEEALGQSQQEDWNQIVPNSRLILAQAAHWIALLLAVLVLWNLPRTHSQALLAKISDFSVTVSPGDTALEHGSSLIVIARFRGPVPSGVEMVIAPERPSPTSGTRRVPLGKSLADPLFGATVPEISSNLVYHLEYADQRTRDFRVTVFEYPRLERADVDITYPAYTAQSPKRIENTRRLSAVEGSRVDVALQLNKPVAAAKLVARDKTVLPLQVEADRAVAFLKDFPLVSTGSYDLQLVDADGRTNKIPAQFVFAALTNRTPEIRIASPPGDVRPSSIEEISFDGSVWDDFGVRAYGLAFTLAGQETRFIELGREVAAKEKQPFKYVLRLEDLGVQPDQLVAWYPWAEDIGPDGQVRRATGDLYFAEIRPFDEVFREGQQPAGGEAQSGQASQSSKLIELQKKIISATWNLQRQHGTPSGESKAPALRDSKPAKDAGTIPARQSSVTSPLQQMDNGLADEIGTTTLVASLSPRERVGVRGNGAFKSLTVSVITSQIFGQPSAPAARSTPSSTRTNAALSKNKLPSYQDDATVVRDSQAQAVDQAEGASTDARDARARALWATAVKEMEQALAHLTQATNSPVSLPEALTAEQSAYQALLKLQEHEYQVMRNRNRGQGGGGNNDRMQRQLEQMDLAQSENRYETQRQAQKPKNNQFQEQLQVMNRLSELARRQQDLNDRLKELQTALQEARTEQEREEIRRRLKRLQEDEQQMLADVDELRQRMDRPENQSRMAEERKQLEQTRQDIQRAAEASSQGAASQALAAGTRAQSQLQQMREQMRKENSNQFADDLRQMRAEARELARQQEELLKKLNSNTDSGARKSLSDAPQTEELLHQLDQQKERMTNLVEHATQLSQQAEEPEPLLSRQLYDSVRKFSQDNLNNVRQTQEELFERRAMTGTLYEMFKDTAAPDGPKLMDVTAELLRQNNRREAAVAGQRTRRALDELKAGVERAAESILGDDTEALRLAQQQLEQLTEQLGREMAQAETNNASTNRSEAGAQAGADATSTNLGPASSAEQKSSALQAANNASEKGNPGNETAQGQADSQSGEDQNGPSRSGQQPGQNGNSQDQQRGAQAGSRGQNPNNQQAQTPTRSRSNSRTTQAGGGGNETAGAWLRDFDRSLNKDNLSQAGPLTGGAYGPWSDRLREVEEVLEFPDLRNQVAVARERARLMRQELKRDQRKPDWAVVRLQVMKPLLEVRDQIADELARRDSKDALVPIDRDPVPTRYSDLVRRYYEDLGKAQPVPKR